MILDHQPIQIPLYFVDDDTCCNENNNRAIVSFQPILYREASTLLNIIEAQLRIHLPTAMNSDNIKKKKMKQK